MTSYQGRCLEQNDTKDLDLRLLLANRTRKTGASEDPSRHGNSDKFELTSASEPFRSLEAGKHTGSMPEINDARVELLSCRRVNGALGLGTATKVREIRLFSLDCVTELMKDSGVGRALDLLASPDHLE